MVNILLNLTLKYSKNLYKTDYYSAVMGNVLVFIFLTSLIVVSGCLQSETYIQKEITEANYCETDEDCVDAGGKCPFGCYIYVNKNDANRIKNLVSSYRSNCIYQCMYCPSVECKNNKCEPVCS
jgi:hypothetical protein